MEPEVILRTVEEVLALERAATAEPVPVEVDREHMRLISDTLVRKVEELKLANERLEEEVSQRRIAERNSRESEERLRRLSHQLLRTQEDERRHMARELHDEIGQSLTAVKINLQRIRGKDAISAPGLEESVGLIEGLLDQVRGLSLDLRPAVLDDLGLASALRWHVDRLAQRTGLETRFIADSLSGRLDSDIETACFRVAQEALTNVVRHARARHIAINLIQANNALELIIRDDGIGFDADLARDRARQGASLGLLGMQERVALLGGQFTIAAAPGSGTDVKARFPLASTRPQPGTTAETNHRTELTEETD
jgi:signal transduction histidine kinase